MRDATRPPRAGGHTPDPAQARHELTLDALPVGRPARVVSINGEHGLDLALEGLLPGTDVAVASRSPFGGPLVVCIGRARVAVPRAVAAKVSIEVVADLAAQARG